MVVVGGWPSELPTRRLLMTTNAPVNRLCRFTGNPQAYNRYSYVLNNPVRHTDPSGRLHDPDADYGRGYYNYYNLSSHPAYRQDWYQAYSRWRYVTGQSGLHWVKPDVRDYNNYLSSETACSQIANAASVGTGAAAHPASLALGAGYAFGSESTITARDPHPKMYWGAAPPKTYAGREIVVDFDASQVDWSDVGMDVVGLATLGGGQLCQIGSGCSQCR